MKYLMFGDIHGTDLEGMGQSILDEGFDVVLCTGDFDQVRSIRQFMEIENDLRKNGTQVLTVPGNHDHAVLKNLSIYSGALDMQDKTIDELHRELMRDPLAREFLEELVFSGKSGTAPHRYCFNLDSEKHGNEYDGILVHGGYDGDLHSLAGGPKGLKNLWVRLRSEDDHAKNFRTMKDKGHTLMVRSHDHHPSYTYNDPEKGIVTYEPNEEEGNGFRLKYGRQHTITTGALFENCLARIDTGPDAAEIDPVNAGKYPHLAFVNYK